MKPRLYETKARMRRAVAIPLTPSLTALAAVYRSDKLGGHGYLPYFKRHFRSRRLTVRRLLEIGVGGYSDPYAGGNSLRMWRSFFPLAQVYGLDTYPKAINEPRVTVVQGSQDDPSVLADVVARAGGGFDIVIDDGSHLNAHVRATFSYLLPVLSSGGVYVIEDLQTAYDPESGGGPPGTHATSMALVKETLDWVNRMHVRPGEALPELAKLIAAVHCYPNIVFFERSAEVLGSPPM